MTTPLLEIEDLKVHFAIAKTLFGGASGTVRAVDGVTFDIAEGETLGLVGESGSGKTTVGRALLRALDPTSGRVTLNLPEGPLDVASLKGGDLQRIRKHLQLIFQDPYSSLNPRMTVRDIIAEPLECNRMGRSRAKIDERVREIAEKCKLNVEHLRRFPHAFSGGQRQRICIARALVSNPKFVVCDESVSALDVSIQAEIINLLMDLQKDLGLTYLFIAHDLSVVATIATRVAVMYVGCFVELGTRDALFSRPRHPYTRALLSAIPTIEFDRPFEPIKLAGEIPNPANAPSGCRFHTRCPFAKERCKAEIPLWREIEPGHHVACHFAEDLDLSEEGMHAMIREGAL